MLCALQILRFDRVGRREPAPTTKRNVHLNPVGDGVPDVPNTRTNGTEYEVTPHPP